MTLFDEIESRLRWKRVMNDDWVAKHKDFVFRLQYRDIGVYAMGKAWVLQVRKKDESEFKSTGAAFWNISDGTYSTWKDKSVDKKLWKSIEDVIPRAEQILDDLGYL